MSQDCQVIVLRHLHSQLGAGPQAEQPVMSLLAGMGRELGQRRSVLNAQKHTLQQVGPPAAQSAAVLDPGSFHTEMAAMRQPGRVRSALMGQGSAVP